MIKRNSVGGRCSLCIPLVAGGLMMLTPEAHADWVLKEMRGTEKGVSTSQQPGGAVVDYSFSNNWQSPPPSDGTAYHSQVAGAWAPEIDGNLGPGVNMLASVELSNIKVILEWQGSGSPTADCYLKIQSSASASAGSGKQPAPSWTVSVSNGLAGGQAQDGHSTPMPPQIPSFADGVAAYIAYNQAYNAWFNAVIPGGSVARDGSKYIKIDTSSPQNINGVATVVKTIGLTPTAKGTLSATGWISGYDPPYASGSVGINVKLVNRAVRITGLGQTYRKSTSAPTVPAAEPGQPAPVAMLPVPFSNPPVWQIPVAPEDTQESAASWHEDHQSWRAGVAFYSAIDGFVTPERTWTFSGGNVLSSPQSSMSIIPGLDSVGGVIDLGSNEDSLSTSNSSMTLDVVDQAPGSPSETLTDKYSIRWHTPFENWEQIGAAVSFRDYPTLTRISGSGSTGGEVRYTWVKKGAYYAEAVGAAWGSFTAILGSVVPTKLKPLFAALKLTSFPSQLEEDAVNFDSSWTSADPLNPPTWVPFKNDAFRSDYRITAERYEGREATFWSGDAYNQSGYAGQARVQLEYPTNSSGWIVTFTAQSPITPPTPGSH